MPELTRVYLNRENWFGARKWAQDNASRFDLAFYGSGSPARFTLRVPEPYLSLDFEVMREKAPQTFLYDITIANVEAWIRWCSGLTSADPPETLEELVATGSIERRTGQGRPGGMRKRLKAAVDAWPSFYKAYEGVFGQLFPKLEHWELTGAPEEDYLESLHENTGAWHSFNIDPDNLAQAIEAVQDIPELTVRSRQTKGFDPNVTGPMLKVHAETAQNFQFRFNLYFYLAPDNRFAQMGIEIKPWNKDLYYDYDEFKDKGIPPTLDEFLEAALAEYNISLQEFKRSDAYRKYPKSWRILSQFYETFMERLYPRLEHWQLTAAPEEEYMEALQHDEALLRALKDQGK